MKKDYIQGKTLRTKINIYLIQQNLQVLKTMEDLIIMDIEDCIRSTTNKDNYWYVLHYFKIVQTKLFLFF